MRSNQWWKQHALGAACTTLLLGACAVDGAGDPVEDDDVAQADQAISFGCTAVKLTVPAQAFQVGAGVPTTLTGVATCAQGVTPEYQYWAKATGASNWSIIAETFSPGSITWSIPWAGNWSLEVVARGVGSTARYEVRSTAVNGTAIHINLNPTPVDDEITTTQNVAGSVDVLANDSDPDGDTVSLTGHTDPAHGAVVFVGSLATYTPAHGYVGLDSFTYTVIDGIGGSATGTVNVNVADQAPIAAADTLMARMNASGTVDVLLNDSDPDGDTVAVTSFTQGAHGAVAFTGGVATYTPVASYLGADDFTYTIDDGHGMTATATVSVTVTNPLPGCAISISGPPSGVYQQNLHLTASAVCNTGPAQVQWFHKINSSFVIVQAWSATQTLDYTADVVGAELFYAQVRTLGTTPSQGTSKTASVAVADNTPQCTLVKMVTPANNATIQVGLAQTLKAAATCPAGSTPEYQFWVKATTARNWTVLPGYTIGTSSWTPAVTGAWAVKAVARTVGSHVAYQVGSAAFAVTIAP
jgi:Big-like domain-containing protein